MNKVSDIVAPFYELLETEGVTNADLAAILSLQTGQVSIKRRDRRFNISEMMIISEHYGYQMSLSVTTYSDDSGYFTKQQISRELAEIRNRLESVSKNLEEL